MRLTKEEKHLLWDLLQIADAQPADDDGNGEGDYQFMDDAKWETLRRIIEKFENDLKG